jgi:23S rRNA (cytosine1962-C5)-methyltransferase
VNPHSLIAARILSRDLAHPPGRSLFVHRLKVALALRERLYEAAATARCSPTATACPG